MKLVLRRTRARMWAGRAGVVWFVGLSCLALGGDGRGLPTVVLLLALPLMLAAAGLSFAIPLPFDCESPPKAAHQLATTYASYRWPLAAVAAVGPLTLHALFFPLFFPDGALADFDIWIKRSVPLIGLVHLPMVILIHRHATARADLDPYPIEGSHEALAWTLGAAATLPGAVLLGMPAVIVAITSGLLVRLALAWACRSAVQQRDLITESVRRLPRSERKTWIEDAHASLGHFETNVETQVGLLFLLGRVASRQRLTKVVTDHLREAPRPERGRVNVATVVLAFELAIHLGLSIPASIAGRWTANHIKSRIVELATLCLGRTTDLGPEARSLLQVLLHHPSPRVQIASAIGLRRLGTRGTIDELGALARRTMHTAVRAQARRAIAAINRRSGGAGPASLSLATDVPNGGQFSIVRPAGEVSETA